MTIFYIVATLRERRPDCSTNFPVANNETVAVIPHLKGEIHFSFIFLIK